jgi:hypothetical protein
MICEFCNSELKSKSSLNAHKKKAKYCVEAQQKLKGSVVKMKTEVYTCEGCEKEVTTSHASRHRKTCVSLRISSEKETLIRENQILKAKLSIYEKLAEKDSNRIFEIAKQPRVQTTNKTKITLTPLDLSESRLRPLVEAKFTRNHLLEGQKGVAKFTVDHILKDDQGKLMYVCTDPSRHSYKFLAENGEEIKDIKSRKLTEALYPSVNERSRFLVNEGIAEQSNNFPLYTDSFIDINSMGGDNSDFRAELATMTSM